MAKPPFVSARPPAIFIGGLHDTARAVDAWANTPTMASKPATVPAIARRTDLKVAWRVRRSSVVIGDSVDGVRVWMSALEQL
jgi:hypothetical protein